MNVFLPMKFYVQFFVEPDEIIESWPDACSNADFRFYFKFLSALKSPVCKYFLLDSMKLLVLAVIFKTEFFFEKLGNLVCNVYNCV